MGSVDSVSKHPLQKTIVPILLGGACTPNPPMTFIYDMYIHMHLTVFIF
jgi:hypothetical protein